MTDEWEVEKVGKNKYRVGPAPKDDGCLIGIIAVIIGAIIAGIVAIWENKTARKICLTILGVMLLGSVIYATIRPVVDPFYGQPIQYSLSDNGEYYSVSGVLDSKASNIEIPATIDGKPVKYISDSAFKDCENITSITIHNGILSIGASAFEGCKSLTNVVIPNSVTSIGDSAFRNCYSLTSITIPNSVTNVGESVFLGCGSLTSVTLSNNMKSIPKQMFYSCKSLKSVTIPNSVTSIYRGAFAFCNSLTSITIPKSVNYIGELALANNDSLTSINYLGTKSQWDAIDKYEGYDFIDGILNWDCSSYNYIVSCTDGTISK